MGGPEFQVTFPLQQARTRRFTAGMPRNFTVSPDGRRVVFIRSASGDDPAASLWVLDVETGAEREVASEATVGRVEMGELPPEERARRERSREISTGIVSYACDGAVTSAVFALAGKLWFCRLDGSELFELDSPGGVFDPRLDPTGARVAFVARGSLYVTQARPDAGYNVVAEEADPDVSWGLAEFIAAEEMGRSRGYWWSPEGDSLLVARADNRCVQKWWISDPSHPESKPVAHRYPVAGSKDAEVTLWHLSVSDGTRQEVTWDRENFPYLVTVNWSSAGSPLLLVERRDHKACSVLEINGSWQTSEIATHEDSTWVSYPHGLPAWLDDGRLVWTASSPDLSLTVDGVRVTPSDIRIGDVLALGEGVVFTGSVDPTSIQVWRWTPTEGLELLSPSEQVSAAVISGVSQHATSVLVRRSMDWHGALSEVMTADGSARRRITDVSETPVVEPNVRFMQVGDRGIHVGLVLPSGHVGGKLPVVLAPYGGPGARMVLRARSAWLEDQWLADQGFAVLVADGRGTPGRGWAWEREIYHDFAGPVLEDQVDALHQVAAHVEDLDLTRVGIRGWSFGGYLSALAVLKRPDVFHAAVAGAPVTEWRLYDTFYTERFLGDPDENPDSYERSSLLPLASGLRRPLMLIHGLADDNVVAAHTLELSSRLVAAGRPHSVLPLPGITHVASRDDVAQNLLELQVRFLREALADPAAF